MPVTPLPSAMCSAALLFARRGWPVFPCRERESTSTNAAGKVRTFKAKAPYTGQGLKDATTDETRIRAWWRDNPDALIGLPMGMNGCFALDFDPRTDNSSGEVYTLERLKTDLEAQMGCALPESLTAVTQSDGVHVYFRQPSGEPIRNRGNLPAHVDVRGVGGYVIAAPSLMVETGARYRWYRGDWRDDATIAEAPSELIEILRAPKARSAAAPEKPAGSQRTTRTASVEVDADVRKYALAALDGECRTIRAAPHGNHNPQFNISSLKIASLVAAGALDAGIARSSIEAACLSNPGSDDERAVLATVNSGWTAGLANPRDLGEITAAARSRRERGPPRTSSRPSPPTPKFDDDGQPSSHSGGQRFDIGGMGPGGAEGDALTRECAFLPHTDLGNLERFLKRYGRDFLFVEQWGWLAWDGRRWNRDMAVSLLGRAVQDTMRAIQEEAAFIHDSGVPVPPLELYDAEQLRAHEAQQRGRFDRTVKRDGKGNITLLSDTIAKWGRTSEGAGHIACIAKMAEARLSARPDDFDTDPLLLNVENGTLQFRRPGTDHPAGVRLIKARRDDRITKIAAVAYDVDAKCRRYDTFLEEVQPKADMREWLDCWAGYNALGLADAQKMALYYGQGSNGKSVDVDVKAHILGDYARVCGIETFIDQGKYRKGSDATPDLAALAGRRMVRASEPEDGSKFSDGLIKAMTGSEPVPVRELLKPPFEMPVTFKVTVSANNKPKIGTDHGIQRRMALIPWDVIIPDDRQDTQLTGKLKAEASGILNRMIRGAIQYLTTGLPEPEAVREATREYQQENDLLGQFLTLCIVKAPGETIGASKLHALFAGWQTWANQVAASGKPWSPKHLNAQMQKKGYTIRKSSTMMWDDIAALFDVADFVDADMRPVSTPLPDPRRTVPLTDIDDDDILPP